MIISIFLGGVNLKEKSAYSIIKRVIDVVLSVVLLFFLAVPMLIIGLAVALTSKGGAIFSQKRIGKNKKSFICYKFRTMRREAPLCSAKQMAESGGADKYFTPLGKILRSTSLDELPQLWNVLKGDMSLVGPRPLIECEVDVHSARESNGVYSIRPGITGLAQIKGRNRISDDKKVELDAQYLNNFGLAQDLRIIGLTAIEVFFRRDVNA